MRMSGLALISVVEDDHSLRRALLALIKSLGYAASGHPSAEAFLETGEERRSSCIITDIQMPGMSGIDLKVALAGRKSTIPVIMITARTERPLLERARESGAACLLQKPFQADALLACLNRVLAC
jgi:FixJ family two-component response regulator